MSKVIETTVYQLAELSDAARENARRETAELKTVQAALGKEFPQKDELTLVRENHGAIIRELQRMQDEQGYVSTWEPKTSLDVEAPPMPIPTPAPQLTMRCG